MNEQLNPERLVGSQLVDSGSQRIGKIGQVFLDDETATPQWVTVQTGFFGSRESFVPLAGAHVGDDGDLQVPYSKDQVKDAPSLDAADGHLSEAEEAALYRYYGLGQTETFGRTGEGERTWARGGDQGHDTSGPTTDDAMTRSEERLRAATERVEAGRARLRKYVVTEQQQVTVPVSREQVRLEREPVTDANVDQAMSGPDLSEEEHEVVLTEERPVVTTEAVPVERVRMAKHAVESEETVSADVRKERIEVEGDAPVRGDVDEQGR
ncbi:MAG TPA: PRC and DUF2382 domain-containing protein [Kineosporiaceae bacterium]|nr:PRC and DUF2382 domain-containing protein [Kineosporiaceae bacterium]